MSKYALMLKQGFLKSEEPEMRREENKTKNEKNELLMASYKMEKNKNKIYDLILGVFKHTNSKIKNTLLPKSTFHDQLKISFENLNYKDRLLKEVNKKPNYFVEKPLSSK